MRDVQVAYLGEAAVATRAVLPIAKSVCSIFMCQNKGMAVNACDCAWGLNRQRKIVSTESWRWEKNLVLHQGIKPASAACQSDAWHSICFNYIFFCPLHDILAKCLRTCIHVTPLSVLTIWFGSSHHEIWQEHTLECQSPMEANLWGNHKIS